MYGQMEMDLRLRPEIELEENIGIVIEFAHSQLEEEKIGNSVKNRHEGYGLLAERFANLSNSLKNVKDGMTAMLRILPVDDHKAIDAVASIDNSLTDLVVAAVSMAAEAKRINDDLYKNLSDYKTPLEMYSEGLGDGFEEAMNEPEGEEDGLSETD